MSLVATGPLIQVCGRPDRAGRSRRGRRGTTWSARRRTVQVGDQGERPPALAGAVVEHERAGARRCRPRPRDDPSSRSSSVGSRPASTTARPRSRAGRPGHAVARRRAAAEITRRTSGGAADAPRRGSRRPARRTASTGPPVGHGRRGNPRGTIGRAAGACRSAPERTRPRISSRGAHRVRRRGPRHQARNDSARRRREVAGCRTSGPGPGSRAVAPAAGHARDRPPRDRPRATSRPLRLEARPVESVHAASIAMASAFGTLRRLDRCASTTCARRWTSTAGMSIFTGHTS